MKYQKPITFVLVTLIIIVLDQFSKIIIKTKFLVNQSIPIIKNIFHLTYIQNTGAGFGLFQGFNIFLIIITIVIIALIIYYYTKIPEQKKLPVTLTALVLGGAIGNLINRLFYGFVIDFLDFRIWPAFNLADAAITIGVIGLIIYFWKK